MSTNGIAPETFPGDECEWKARRIEVVELRRNLDGSWTMELDVDTLAVLPDGRRVRFVGELRLKGRQFGRKKRKVTS